MLRYLTAVKEGDANVALIVVLIVVGVIIVGGAVAFVNIKKKRV